MSDADDLDRMLSRAGRALRDEVSGASDDAARTRARVLATRRGQAQRTVWAMAAAAVLAVGLGAPTVWAWSTGRLAQWFDGSRDAAEEMPEVEGASAGGESANEPVVIEPTVLEPTVTEPAVIEPVIAAPRPEEPASLDRTGSEPDGLRATASEPEREVVDPAERRAYRAAHALHFETRDTERALGAWQQYLASYPRGRFAPEARYNSALCLVRLGRRDDAREALSPFAEGAHGSYRQREAAELLDAMSE